MRKYANSKSCPITTVFLSFLKHERERDFAIVSERLSCTVWTFPSVQRFMTISELFGRKRSWNGHETPFLLILLFGYESDQTKKHDLWTLSNGIIIYHITTTSISWTQTKPACTDKDLHSFSGTVLHILQDASRTQQL